MVHKTRGKGGEKLKIAYTNMDGLISARWEVEEYLKEMKPDIMALTETKITEGLDVSKIGGEKYNVWSRNRLNKQGGGVMFIVKKEILVAGVVYGKGQAEFLQISIKFKGKKKRDLAVVYIPPKTVAWETSEYEEMLNDMKECLKEMLKESDNIILMGDFNCKEVSWEEWTANSGEKSWGNFLLDLSIENIMTQWIKENTRYRGGETPSRLDLVFTKEPDIIEDIEYKTPLGKSDHVVLEFKIHSGWMGRNNEDHKVDRLDYKRTNFTELRKFFKEADWSRLINASQIDEKWESFSNIYHEGVGRYVPKMSQKTRGKSDWYNKKCGEARKNKELAWKRWRRNRRQDLWEKYKLERNKYTSVCREEKRNYEKDIVDKCKDQPKLFYKYVNSKMKHKEGIEVLKVNGIEYEDVADMTEVMNTHFHNVFTREKDFRELRVDEINGGCLQEIEVTLDSVKDIIRSLDVTKARGPDGISNWILKECIDELAGKLQVIIQCSLNEGKMPEDWKRADIVPIYKGGNREDPNNYRPVSLTSVVAKICERVIKGDWMKHLEDNKILTDRQFGFREGRSCMTNLVSFYSRVIDIVQEREGWADCIYLDLKKAFDKVPHKKLLWKLKNIGMLGGKLLCWMEDFLKDRVMRTVIKGVKSSWKKVISGVPQGTVLAPVMFLVYVNDMIDGVDSYMSMFADDTKILRRIHSKEDQVILQQDLEKVWKWSQTWEMEFNIKKCSVMEMGRSSRRLSTNYKLGNTVISKRKEEKDLGVTFTETLSPGIHINKIVGEAFHLLKNIRVAFAYLDEDMMKKIIVTMIRPRLEYAAIVWSPWLRKDVRKIERILRAATKMIPRLRDMTYENRLQELNILSLEQRRERGDMIAIYKLMTGKDYIDREELLVWDSRETRGHGCKLRKSNYRRDIKKNSFPHRNVDTWNRLDNKVVQAKSISIFKEKLDKCRYGDGTVRA